MVNAFSTLTCWLGGRKGIRPVKNRVVRCRHGYLSGARCRFAYGPADTTATHCLLHQEIQISFGFTFLVPAHPGSPGQNPENCKMVVIVVAVPAALVCCAKKQENIYFAQRKLLGFCSIEV